MPVAINREALLAISTEVLIIFELYLLLWPTLSSNKWGIVAFAPKRNSALDFRSADRVAIRMEDTVHYGLYDEDEWRLLSPKDGIVYEDGNAYVLSMFHQLNCLDVLRQAVIRSSPRASLNDSVPLGIRSRRCVNYLRQMILCRANTELELVTSITGAHSVLFDKDYICNDWGLVYKAAKVSQVIPGGH